MSFLKSMFGTEQPVIGLIHLHALPGDPFYRGEGMTAVIDAAGQDLEALQAGGIDGVLFTNEFSLPYEQRVSPVTLAAMGMVIGALRSRIRVPFGAEAIFDGDATMELCAGVEADFTRCMFTGVWAGDLGLIDRNIAATLRRKYALRLDTLKLFYFVTSEGDACVGGRTPAQIAASLLTNCRPDALVVGGNAPGISPGGSLLEDVAAFAGEVPVICGTGLRQDNLSELLPRCSGAFVGTALKKDGKLENPVDPDRVIRFMETVRRLREDSYDLRPGAAGDETGRRLKGD